MITARQYDTPGGKVGRRFMREMRNEIRGVRARKCNVVHFIAFQEMILQCAHRVITAHAIQRIIGKLLDAWESGQHHMLVEYTA